MKQKKYDTSIIDNELKRIKRKSFFDFATQFCWTLYPFGCMAILTALALLFAIIIVLWISEPSLTGNY